MLKLWVRKYLQLYAELFFFILTCADKISMDLSILYFKRSQVDVSHFNILLSKEIVLSEQTVQTLIIFRLTFSFWIPANMYFGKQRIP